MDSQTIIESLMIDSQAMTFGDFVESLNQLRSSDVANSILYGYSWGNTNDYPVTPGENSLSKSRQLLIDHMTPQQHHDLLTRNLFVVIGSSTGHEYQISTIDTSGNITRSDGLRFCLSIDETKQLESNGNPHPKYDLYLTQMLMIEADEESFLNATNVWRGYWVPFRPAISPPAHAHTRSYRWQVTRREGLGIEIDIDGYYTQESQRFICWARGQPWIHFRYINVENPIAREGHFSLFRSPTYSMSMYVITESDLLCLWDHARDLHR